MEYGPVKCADLKKIVRQGYRDIIEASTKAQDKFYEEEVATRPPKKPGNFSPAEETSGSGVYQDKDGVWRNY